MGEVELSLVGPAQWAERDGADVKFTDSGVPVHVDAARGVLYGDEGGGEGGGRKRWQRQMTAPITSLWVQDGLRLSRVNLSSHSALPSGERPTLMMGEPAVHLQCIGGLG